MPDTRSTPKAIESREREARVIELRRNRVTFEVIAQEVGYADASGAFRAFRRGMQRTVQEPADDLRRLESDALDVLYRAMLPIVIERDPDTRRPLHPVASRIAAVQECLRIQKRRADLWGLDAPVRRIVDLVNRDAFLDMVDDLETEFKALEQVLADGETSE